MTDDLLQCDARSEVFKGSCHLALFALAAVCAAYNAGAAVLRPSSRLVTQAVLYAALSAHEAVQAAHHFSASGARR